MHESEENNISSVAEFKVFVDLVSGEVKENGRMFPLHLVGPGLGPWRLKS